jgi:biopolymer transport protein ExbD
MLDDILQRRPKRHIKDLNIVPILDMLTTVIFFLLMSTSFIEYTKLTLPPASTSSAPIESKDPPVAPKVFVTQKDGDTQYNIRLQWAGGHPGQQVVEADEASILAKTQELLKNFTQNYPKEKTLQVSMGKLVKYQALISVMDGARDYTPDMVLMSYME